MFSNSRWWGFQHMLSKVNEDLVQFTSPQQVKVLYDLKQQQLIHCESKSAPAKAYHQQIVLFTLSCPKRSDSSTIKVHKCYKKRQTQIHQDTNWYFVELLVRVHFSPWKNCYIVTLYKCTSFREFSRREITILTFPDISTFSMTEGALPLI